MADLEAAAVPAKGIDPAKEAAHSFEHAAKDKSSVEYNGAMQEVNKHLDELKNDPQATRAYLAGIKSNIGRDILPICELLELKSEMGGEPAVRPFHLRLLEGQSNINDLQRGFLHDVRADYSALNAVDGMQHDLGITSLRLDQEITARTQKLINKANLEHLFDKRSDGTCLYDHLQKDEHGNIVPRAIDRLFQDPTITGADKDSLNLLWNNRNKKAFWTNDLNQDQVKSLFADNGALFGKKAPPPEPAKAVEAPVPPPTPEVTVTAPSMPPIDDGDDFTAPVDAGDGGKKTDAGTVTAPVDAGDGGKKTDAGTVTAPVDAGDGGKKTDAGTVTAPVDAGDGGKKTDAGTVTAPVDAGDGGKKTDAGTVTAPVDAGGGGKKTDAGTVTAPVDAGDGGKKTDAGTVTAPVDAGSGPRVEVPTTANSDAARAAAERKEALEKALTVLKGDSYAQSAEKLLKLAGHKDPSAYELKKLSHQLWVADHRRKAYGLPINHVLAVDDTIKRNKALAALFAGAE